MRIIEAMKESTLRLGYQGEDERTRVVFDLSDLIDEFGVGTVTLLVVRPWEREGSPVVISQGEDGQYYWDVTDADLQNEGGGEAQIVFIPEGRVAKTHVWKTIVARSISESENPPEPWQGWVDQVLEAAAEVEQTAQEIPTLIDTALQEAKDSGEFDGQDGEDGFSPLIGITDIPGGHRITITDAAGTHTADIMDGVDGADGMDGVSPLIQVTDITGGHRLTITDASGTKTVDILDGVDGRDGTDGYSPTVAVTDITGGHQVVITDANGAHTFNIMDGTNGTNGTNGSDGYSPTISVTDITGGHRLTITDVNGSRTVDVMDGEDAHGSTFYGTCSAVDSGTGVCTVVSSGYDLAVGGLIAVAFSVNVPQYANMNVASTGSKPISFKGSNILANIIKSGDKALFVYDGTYYTLLSIDRTAEESGGGTPYAVAAAGYYYGMPGYWDVSIPSITQLYDGLTIRVKFPDGLSASGNRLKLNELAAPDDNEQFYSIIGNLPANLMSVVAVLDLTYVYRSGYGYLWVCDMAPFNLSSPAPVSMGIGFYYEASTHTEGGGPGGPSPYTVSEVIVPNDFKVHDSQWRYGAMLYVHFDANVSANGEISIHDEDYYISETGSIYFRGSAITANVIKSGDLCLFVMDSNYNFHLVANDRWGVGVS